MLKTYVRAIRFVSQLCGFVAAGLTGAAVVVVCHMVFVRYVLNDNTIWQTDFTTYSLIAATFIGSPYVLMTHGHVNVDVVPLHLRSRARWWLGLVTNLVTLSFCAVVAVLAFQFWKEAWDNSWLSDTMWRARLWIPYASLPLGLGLMTLQSLADVIELISGREPPFGLSGERET